MLAPGIFPKASRATETLGAIRDIGPVLALGGGLALNSFIPPARGAVIRRRRVVCQPPREQAPAWRGGSIPFRRGTAQETCSPTGLLGLGQVQFRELGVKLLVAWSLRWSECLHCRNEKTLQIRGFCGLFLFHVAGSQHTAAWYHQMSLLLRLK